MDMAKSFEHNQATQSANEGELAFKDHSNSLEIGCEDCFREVVGLQNWGIDSLRDINPVKNQDLQQIFGEKVPMKGYSYLNCKSKKLKRRMEELYKPLFQQLELPKEGYIPESFARAVVSEALHFTSINWAVGCREVANKRCTESGNSV